MSIQEATRPTPVEGRFDWTGPAPRDEPAPDHHLTVHTVRTVDSSLARFVGVTAAVILTLLATAALWALDAPVTVQLLAYVGVVVVLTLLIARMLPDRPTTAAPRRSARPSTPSRH
ncbi:MAG: hypothetical protein ACOYOP_13130 [Microthrixaceae bacterium]